MVMVVVMVMMIVCDDGSGEDSVNENYMYM